MARSRTVPTRRIAATALAALLLAPAPGAAEYRLQPGDVLEIAIAGRPDFRQTMTVSVDGEIAVPLLGPLAVAGLPLSEVRRRVKEELPAHPLRERTPDGRSVEGVIEPDAITLTVAEYRPVYVSGDVASPGAQAFRPGMTVRQAVALAGGYDLVRFRVANPVIEAAGLRAEHDALATELAREHVRAARLQAELEGAPDLVVDDLGGAVPRPLLDEIAALGRRQLAADRAQAEREKDYLRRVIAQTEQQIASLAEQRQKQDEGVRQQTEDAAKVRENFARNLVPISRVTDEQRSLLLASDRLLQTATRIAEAERQREEFGRDLQKVEEQRRLTVLGELQEARAAVAALRARLDGTARKLAYIGTLPSRLAGGSEGGADLLVVRNDGSAAQRLAVAEDAPLMPGDVLEVAIRERGAPDLATR